MNKKKILWIGILAIFIIAIIVIVILVKPKDTNVETNTVVRNSTVSDETKQDTDTDIDTDIDTDTDTTNTDNDSSSYIRTELSDGVLYSVTGEKVSADITLSDNYFDTTISDMMLNPQDYEGKTIEVEGMYMENLPYTFVGRYSTSNLCADCPTGYSYIEYELNGEINENFTDEETWIKVIGTFSVGMDNFGTQSNPYYSAYYYLDVLNLEIMNEKGQDTVNN